MESTMKKIGKVVIAIVIALYTILAIILTLCLFNLNDKGYAEFELSTVIALDDNYSNEYKEGDLLIISKKAKNKSDVEVGDGIFYYAAIDDNTVEYGEVTNVIQEDRNNQTYVIGADHNVYSNTFIGNRVKNLGHIGGFYKVLMSQFGYLALVILPTLIAVVVEIYAIIMEILTIKNEMAIQAAEMMRANETTK